MNENPEGTPNPLNPAPGTENEMAAGTGPNFVETEQASEVIAEPETPAEPEVPAEPDTPTESEMPAEPEAPAEPEVSAEPETPAEPETVPVNHTTMDPMMKPVSHNNFDTLGVNNVVTNDTPVEEIKEETFIRSEAPMTLTPASDMPELVAKDSIVEPVGGSSKKKVLIIGAIILVMIAIICGGVAVAFMMVNNTDDRVSKAIDKLINGEISSIVNAKGNISATTDTAEVATNIDFDGTFDLRSSMNAISATVNADLASGTNISIGVNELRNKDGETYFKISGLTDMTNKEPAEESDASVLLSMYGGLLQVVDDEWILASGDFANAMGNLGIFENDSTCLVDAFGSLPQYSKDIANKYKQNQFITYSTDKLGISKKQNNLYKLGFDEDKLTAFINSLSNNGFVNELNACANETATNTDISVSKIKEIFDGFPTVYVEINDKYDFTRVYFQATTSAGEDESASMTVTADLNLSYPSNFTIEEPQEYTDMSTLLDKVMTNLLNSGSTL